MVMNGPAGLPPKIVGATETPLELTAAGVEASLRLDPQATRELAAALAAPEGPRRGQVILRLDGITGQTPANLTVDVTLPEPPARASLRHKVGAIGLFGLAQASKSDRRGDGASGLGFSLEASRVLAQLFQESPSLPAELRLHLAPTKPLPPSAKIRIEKITLFHVPSM